MICYLFVYNVFICNIKWQFCCHFFNDFIFFFFFFFISIVINEQNFLEYFNSFLNSDIDQMTTLKAVTEILLYVLRFLMEIKNDNAMIKKNLLRIEEELHIENDIFKACKEGKLRNVKYLIETQNIDICIKGEYEITPLHDACQYGQHEIAEYLISKGADVNAKETLYGRTPLHCACEKDNIQIVDYLISKGADKNAKDVNGMTPLHYASYYNNPDIVKYLISKGANKYATNKFGKTPFDVATSDEMRNILE